MIASPKKVGLLLTICTCVLVLVSCNKDKSVNNDNPQNAKIEKLKILPGFTVKHLYSPSEKGQGSWVAMTFDSKGRMITSDQYGALYRLQIAPDVDSVVNIE